MHKEIDFEATIEADLLEKGGYVEGEAAGFEPKRALFPEDFFDFVQRSQADVWKKLENAHGQGLKGSLLDALAQAIAHQGRLSVVRHGFKFYGETMRCAFFKPAHGLNPETELRFLQNRVAVTRQVFFDEKTDQSVDVVVSLNGITVATLELKNHLTNQTFKDAIKQYRTDRDPKNPLFRFKTGALVHFAVDPDEVYMATELRGKGTRFLPFNKGNAGGKGNATPAGGGYKTGYLWREVLERDSFIDIIGRFMHLLVEEKKGSDGKLVKTESLIFPRYHQLDVVRRLEATARLEGAGHNYLVQHSAGSGKSNSIAWAAHRLASLHDEKDQKIFNSVVVVTDRRVLDKQLQDTIYQFEHKAGVVECIDKHSDQLADALAKGTSIIITTLQKFPFVSEKIGKLPDRRYAIIVDEAHSSQTGDSAQKLKEVLATKDDTEDPDDPTWEDKINDVMSSRGPQPNLSFFAFTATPKAKTLEMFGRSPAKGEKPIAFHLYTMRQAIEENFILDVLKNYTTYKTYYKLIKVASEDPDVKKKEAAAALARFVSLHPSNISQKVEIIIEHFRAHVAEKIDGRAKAMVVTCSRLHAVRYKKAFDKYVKEHAYTNVKALVAFSGTVADSEDGQSYSELGMNPGQKSERELPDMFDGPGSQVLIVANKYQTGFDQPLLHTMYVDRKLTGVQVVQTLSRLNRTRPGKVDTFVLDFMNEAAEIQAAFQPFYEGTTISEHADPTLLYNLQHDLDKAQMWTDSEVEAFAKIYYSAMDPKKAHEQLYKHLEPAKDRFKHWEDKDAKEQWRAQLGSFVRLYAFLSQVMPFTDRDLEVRYSFTKLLMRYLEGPLREHYDFTGDVELEYLPPPKKTGTIDIELEGGKVGELKPPTDVGTTKPKEDRAKLGEIIEVINERFGTEFKPEDKLFLDHAVETAKGDNTMVTQAQANTYDNFALAAAKKVEDLMIDGMSAHQGLVSKYLDDPEVKKMLNDYLTKRLYEEIRAKTP